MDTVFTRENPDGITSPMAADIFLDWLFWMSYETGFPLNWSFGAYPLTTIG